MIKKKLSDRQMLELERITKRILLSLDFLKKRSKSNEMYEELKSITIDAYNKRNLRGMRLALKDIKEDVSEFLPENDIAELNSTLLKELGADVSLEEKKTSSKLKRIIKRGYIKNINEYSLIKSYCDSISVDDPRASEFVILDKLLADYKSEVHK